MKDTDKKKKKGGSFWENFDGSFSDATEKKANELEIEPEKNYSEDKYLICNTENSAGKTRIEKNSVNEENVAEQDEWENPGSIDEIDINLCYGGNEDKDGRESSARGGVSVKAREFLGKRKKLITVIASCAIVIGLIAGAVLGILYGVNSREMSILVDMDVIRARVDKFYYVPEPIVDTPDEEDGDVKYSMQFVSGSLVFKGVFSEDAAKDEANNNKIIGFEMLFLDTLNQGNGYVITSDFRVKEINEDKLIGYRGKVMIKQEGKNDVLLTQPTTYICIATNSNNESEITLHFILHKRQYFTLKGKTENDEAAIQKAIENLAGIAKTYYNSYLAYIPTVKPK